MSDEQRDERWTPEEWKEIKAQRARYAEIERREDLRGWVGKVQRVYNQLSHLAEEGSAEQGEFEKEWDHYTQINKTLGSLTREEQDRILEEYPRLVARLEEEHGL